MAIVKTYQAKTSEAAVLTRRNLLALCEKPVQNAKSATLELRIYAPAKVLHHLARTDMNDVIERFLVKFFLCADQDFLSILYYCVD